MEFDELLVTTGVDALVRLVKEKARVELEEASAKLNVQQETLEEWARILEEEGILRIEYRLTKIFLVWVRPTEGEIASEIKSFREEKASVGQEIAEAKGRLVKETEEAVVMRESFSDFYTKAMEKLEKLEKSVAAVPATKAIREDMFTKQEEKLETLRVQLIELKSGLAQIKNELKSGAVGKGGIVESKEMLAHLEEMKNDLDSMQSDMEVIKKKTVSAESGTGGVALPSASEIRKRMDALRKDFAELRNRNSKLREDMMSLQESSELLRGVAEAVMGHDEKTAELRSEMERFEADAAQLMAQANAINAKAKENAKMIARFEDTVNVAKGILTRFPDQKQVMSELDALQSGEEKLDEKMQAAEKLIDAVGGKQLTSKQYDELSKRVDDKLRQIRIEMDSLAAALDDEKATYLAFQKINDRVVGSINSYAQQIGDMEGEITKIEQEAVSQSTNLKKEAGKLQETFKAGGLQEAMQVAEQVEAKKRELEEARELMDDITSLSENLSKRITLLSNQAKLLDIRAGSMNAGIATRAGAEAKDAERVESQQTREARSQIDLSEDEELEFRRKREELKNMIKKLWEEDKG